MARFCGGCRRHRAAFGYETCKRERLCKRIDVSLLYLRPGLRLDQYDDLRDALELGFGLREALDAKFAGLRFILDRPHLRSHPFEIAHAIGLRDHVRNQWVAHKIVLLDGDAEQIETALGELRAHKGRGKKRVGQLLKHLTRFEDALGHDEIRAAGLPVGSGEVESAHRTIPQKRLKLPGAWWRPDTVGKMLGLRVLRANGWWDTYWENAA